MHEITVGSRAPPTTACTFPFPSVVMERMELLSLSAIKITFALSGRFRTQIPLGCANEALRI